MSLQLKLSNLVSLKVTALALLLGVMLSAAHSAEAAARSRVGDSGLRFSPGVEEAQAKLIESDLVRLSGLSFDDQQGQMKRLLKLSDLNAETLKNWLSARVRIVLAANFQLDHTTLRALKTNVNYSLDTNSNSVMSQTIGAGISVKVGKKVEQVVSVSSEPQRNSSIVMSNVGGGLYSMGKQMQVLVGLRLDEQKTIPILSPRVGILRIGAGLFDAFLAPRGLVDLKDRIYSFFRLSTLFHEARHSDGRGASLGFAHANCPEGHDFEGVPACDSPTNGAYRVDALFLSALKANANALTVTENEVIDVLRADSQSRILAPILNSNTGKSGDDPHSTELCDYLGSMQLSADFCAAVKPQEQSLEWDDAPEELKGAHLQ